MKYINKILALFKPPFKTKKRTAFVVVILILIFILYRRNQAQKNIETYIVSRQNITQIVSASGKISAKQIATLNFPTSGKLAWVKVEKGDEVRAWQGLMGMDTQDLNAAYTAAYYQYLSADANAKQIEDDLKNHESDETFAQKNIRIAAQTARDAAYDSWKAAERNLKDATLVSPFAGIVSDLTVNTPGDTISPTDGITVVNPSTLYFQAEIDEVDLGKVQEGQKVNVTLDAFEGKLFTGVVVKINKIADISPTGGVNIKAEIKLDDLSNLVINLNGEAKITINELANVLSIPREYLVTKNGEYFVNLKDRGEQQVELGAESQGNQVITNGLSEGDIIILK